jgi:uncharacterized protein YegL
MTGRTYLALSFALALAACSKASLKDLPEPPDAVIDDKVEIDGEVCTQSPEDLVFPLRVLFLVDCSESMEVSDPIDPKTGFTGRETAVLETAQELLSSGGDAKVSIIRFSSEAQAITPVFASDGTFVSYFTDELAYVEQQIPLLGKTDRTTNFINALSEAYNEIRDELEKADQEALALSTYHVIMITDGIPDAEKGSETSDGSEDIVGTVDALEALGSVYHVEDLVLSTALLSSGNAAVDLQAEDLLQNMAEHGNGTFRKFDSGGELNFLYIDLSTLRRVFTIKTVVVTNLNALSVADGFLPDSDGDFLDDATEIDAGSSPFVPDSDGDGCRDGVEYGLRTSGLDPTNPDDCDCFVPDYCFDDDKDLICDNGCTDADKDGLCDCIDVDLDGLCDPVNYTDGDGDGLTDCEEIWTGTNENGADTDGDGLVDYHEVRFGTSPDSDDIADDSDWDAVPNGEEVRTGTDPETATVSGRYDLAYRYQTIETPAKSGDGSCQDFHIANITLTEPVTTDTLAGGTASVQTGWPGGQGYAGANRILIYAGEVPFDDPESYARFRVACVTARFVTDGNYRNPPSGVVHLGPDVFVNLTDFDPAVDCADPGDELTGPLDPSDTGTTP